MKKIKLLGRSLNLPKDNSIVDSATFVVEYASEREGTLFGTKYILFGKNMQWALTKRLYDFLFNFRVSPRLSVATV